MEQGQQPHDSIKKLLQDVTVPTKEEKPQSDKPPVIDNLEEENETPAATTDKNAGEGLKEKPAVTEKLLESSANVTIATFDFTQDNLFTFFGKIKRKRKMKRLYGDEWETNLNDAQSKLEMAAASKAGANIGEMVEVVTKEDLSILRNEKSFDEYFEGLALTPEETEAIKVPLKEIMRLKGGTIPPEYLLMLTVLQIFGARGMELFDA